MRSIRTKSVAWGMSGALVTLAVACSSGPHPAAAVRTYGGPASVPDASPGPGVDAGVAVDAGADARVSELDANFVDLDAAQFLCNPGATWSAGQPVPGLPSGVQATALSVTPDERSVAWIDGSGTYHVADRAGAGDPFAADQVAAAAASASPLGLSMSVDGLRLVLVKPDAHGFFEVTRRDRSAPFDAPTDGDTFALVDQWVLSLGATVADPVHGSDGVSFLYSQFGAPVTVNESRTAAPGATDTWPVGNPRGGPSVTPVHLDTGNLYRHPVSLSADGLTLFLSDEYPSAPTARAAYRTSLGADFLFSVALGARSSVHANAACDKLYYIENGAILFATRM